MKEKCIKLLKKYTKHKEVTILPSGNAAIFAALLYAKQKGYEKLSIQDQGGWIKYEPYAKLLGFEVIKLSTEYGLLKENINESVLLYTNPTGYFAEQNMKSIYQNNNECFIIVDVAGFIGTKHIDGRYADVMIGSFGKWKPVNMEYGGFISSDQKIDKDILSPFKVYDFYDELFEKLNNVKDRYKMFFEHVKKIKEDLKDFNILHKDKVGINVIVKYKTEKEKDKITDYCEKNNYEYTECPRFIRVNTNAISIEVKRL